MKNKLTKRELQALATRKRIFETARRLFSKYGYNAVSIDDIVREAGVARGSFYVYFLSKEDLSVYLMMDEIGVYQAQIEKSWAALDKSLPAADLIVQTAVGICAMVESWGIETMRTVYKIFIERAATTGSSVKELFEMPSLFTELYYSGVKKGEFKETDANIVAENIKTILVGATFEWCLYHPNYNFTGRSKSLVSDYLNGLKI
jgi:AcrR family transcriptional regulator